jgi:hypothetical protein
LDNAKAADETFVEDENGRWLKTSDEGEIRVCPESGERTCLDRGQDKGINKSQRKVFSSRNYR